VAGKIVTVLHNYCFSLYVIKICKEVQCNIFDSSKNPGLERVCVSMRCLNMLSAILAWNSSLKKKNNSLKERILKVSIYLLKIKKIKRVDVPNILAL